MRSGVLAVVVLGSGCQLVLGLDDPRPPGVVPDADPNAPDADLGWDADPTAPDAEPAPDAVPAGMCLDNGVPRDIDPPEGGELWVRELMPDPASVSDANGEWVELRATGSFDLVGAYLTDTTTTIAFDGGGDCLALVAEDYRLLARSTDAGVNGGLPTVDFVLPFGLPNTGGRLELHHPDGTLLHFVDYAGGTAGTSLIIDDPNVCSAPAGTPSYNGTDIGTPRADNNATCT